MGKINIGRVFLGGIVAGIVSDLLGYFVDGVFLAPHWASGFTALGKTGFSSNMWIYFNLLGLVTAIVMIWLYAAIRPRYGAGVKTAIIAAGSVWVLGVLVPNISFMWVSGLFSHHLTMATTLGGLVELLAGGVAGAYFYKE